MREFECISQLEDSLLIPTTWLLTRDMGLVPTPRPLCRVASCLAANFLRNKLRGRRRGKKKGLDKRRQGAGSCNVSYGLILAVTFLMLYSITDHTDCPGYDMSRNYTKA